MLEIFKPEVEEPCQSVRLGGLVTPFYDGLGDLKVVL